MGRPVQSEVSRRCRVTDGDRARNLRAIATSTEWRGRETANETRHRRWRSVSALHDGLLLLPSYGNQGGSSEEHRLLRASYQEGSEVRRGLCRSRKYIPPSWMAGLPAPEGVMAERRMGGAKGPANR